MKKERTGLVLIGASLLVILLVSGLVARLQRDARQTQTRTQGVSLVRLLSRLPLDELVASERSQGPLQLMRSSQGNPDFAYGVVVDPLGRKLGEVTAPGVIVPHAPLPTDPASWLGERVFDAAQDGGRVREFFAPVLRDGERVAHVRLGFRERGLLSSFDQAPLFGVLALLVFALTPLSYFLVRREMAPLAAATEQIRELARGGQLQPVGVSATGDAGQFVQSFNRFVEVVEGRLQEVKTQQAGALASSRVLAYQKSRVESALEALPDAALVLDDAGRASFANAKLDALLGISPEAVLGKVAEEWCPHPQVVALLRSYSGSAARLARSDRLEFQPDGAGDKTLAVSAHPLPRRGGPGESPGTLVLFRDVTAEVLARSAQAEFVTHVAHELKTPLNGLAMYSEMLLGKDGESEEFRIEACNVFQDEVERLSTLVNTLLSIARIETGNVTLDRQRVRLQDLLKDAVDTVSRGARRSDVRFELQVPADCSAIRVDKELLRVAINNLLTNAVKYNRDGGKVSVTVEESSDKLWIHVEDTGIGVRETDRERIFDKFFRSEDEETRKRAGHGLGLTLAQEIVGLHGGRIALESQPGQGSRFSMVFPRTAALLAEPR